MIVPRTPTSHFIANWTIVAEKEDLAESIWFTCSPELVEETEKWPGEQSPDSIKKIQIILFLSWKEQCGEFWLPK